MDSCLDLSCYVGFHSETNPPHIQTHEAALKTSEETLEPEVKADDVLKNMGF